MINPHHTLKLQRILIAAVVAFAVACGPDLTREELLDRARGSLAEGDINAAIVDVKTALQKSPGDAEGRRLYGEILLRQRDLDRAAEEFRRSLDATFDADLAVAYADTLVDAGEASEMIALAEAGFFDAVGEDARYLAALARAEASEGDLFAAADTLDRAEAIDASLPAVRRARARVLAQHSGDLAAAAQELEKLLEETPEDADVWNLYGSILQAQGKLAEAEQAYARAGEINPFRMVDRLNHMLLLVKQEKYDEAKVVLAQLDRLIPENPGVNYAQARMAMVDGDTDKAVEELDAVLSLLPQHTPSLYLAANANLRRGNLATAQSQIESFLRLRPRNTNARLMLASIHLQRGQPARTLATTREVLEFQPENEAAQLLKAQALTAEGRHEESVAAYASLVALKPESAALVAEYGQALLRAGDAERAAEQLSTAIELAPEDPALRSRLVNARIQLGDTAAAKEDIAAFSAAFPDNPEPSLLLAQLSLREQDRDGARQHFEEALAEDPRNAVARRGLAGLALLESDSDEAAAILSEGLEGREPDLQNLLSLAAVEEQQGDLEAMERTLRRAVEAYPEALSPRLVLARHVLRDGRPGEAVDLLTTVRERYENDSRLQQVLVRSFIAVDQPGAAVTAGRRLAQLTPGDPLALRLAAQAERVDGNLPEAEEFLRSAVEITPDDLETRRLLIAVLLEQGDVEGTSDALADLAESFADRQLLDFARGRISPSLGNPEAAERVLRRAHERKPNDVSLRFLGAALLRNGRFDETVAMQEAWIAGNPQDGLVLDQLGMVKVVRGEDAAAATLYERLLALFPDDVTAMNNLAWSLRESNPERAVDLTDRALELAPGTAPILDTKALALMYAGEYDAALEVLDEVAEQLGEVPPVAFHRAQVLAAAGRKDEARTVLEGLVEGEPFPEQKAAQQLLDSL